MHLLYWLGTQRNCLALAPLAATVTDMAVAADVHGTEIQAEGVTVTAVHAVDMMPNPSLPPQPPVQVLI